MDKRRSELFAVARTRGIPWTSEMNLFLERCRGRLVGVTGSVGKSTTTAMIGEVLRAAQAARGWRHGRVLIGGNIGRSLLDELPAIGPGDLVVLELSSFQLEDAAAIQRSPNVALVTNLRENHLDRHGSLAAYAEAKSNIFRYQREGDSLLLPFADGIDRLPGAWDRHPRLGRFGIDAQRRCTILKLPGGHNEEHHPRLQIPGLHNLQNAAAALAVARLLDVEGPVAEAALAGFRGLAHRLEFIGELRGVKYYNDSKATTPDATITSLAAFEGGVVLIVGGSDKGSSFDRLAQAAVRRAKAIVCTGATGEQLMSAIMTARSQSDRPIVQRAADLKSAVEQARSLATAGDVVLLSPACASYDAFRNYEQRGECFKALVAAG